MSHDIYIGDEYGIDFLDADGKLIEERVFESEEERDAFLGLPDAEFVEGAPKGWAKAKPWQSPLYRRAMRGIDFGVGSVKRRFPQGFTPRGAYQFR